MIQKTVVITGATSGIGFEVCRMLASHGHHIIGVARTQARAQKAREAIMEHFPETEMEFFAGDLMQQREVNRVADEITAYIQRRGGGIDVLINNAGCMRSRYMTTEEGYEQQFALNHLCGFLLTCRLLPLLRQNGGRVLITGSGSHKLMNVRWNNLMFSQRYRPLLAYKQSKLCNMLFAWSLNEKYGRDGINAYVVDPGLVNTDIGSKQTEGIVSYVWSRRKKHGVDASIPAMTFAYLVEQRPAPSGLYYYLCSQRRYSGYVNAKNAQRLFEVSEQLTGISYGR